MPTPSCDAGIRRVALYDGRELVARLIVRSRDVVKRSILPAFSSAFSRACRPRSAPSRRLIGARMTAASSISAALIERARAIPIMSEVARRGIKLRRSGKHWIGPCPRCGGTDRFAVNSARGWNCRGCKPEKVKGDPLKGDVIGFVMWLDGVDFAQAIERLAGALAPAATAVRERDTARSSNGRDDAYERRQHEKAAWLWSRRQPAQGTIVEHYLATRGYTGGGSRPRSDCCRRASPSIVRP